MRYADTVRIVFFLKISHFQVKITRFKRYDVGLFAVSVLPLGRAYSPGLLGKLQVTYNEMVPVNFRILKIRSAISKPASYENYF